mmetsp:Transcript_6414/g.25956  ORF Transcript_6414/g.25956 Transcript_6414/m.25956 type:complete len:287 (-) Transcript_6414:167-1027(-)
MVSSSIATACGGSARLQPPSPRASCSSCCCCACCWVACAASPGLAVSPSSFSAAAAAAASAVHASAGRPPGPISAAASAPPTARIAPKQGLIFLGRSFQGPLKARSSEGYSIVASFHSVTSSPSFISFLGSENVCLAPRSQIASPYPPRTSTTKSIVPAERQAAASADASATDSRVATTAVYSSTDESTAALSTASTLTIGFIAASVSTHACAAENPPPRARCAASTRKFAAGASAATPGAPSRTAPTPASVTFFAISAATPVTGPANNTRDCVRLRCASTPHTRI